MWSTVELISLLVATFLTESLVRAHYERLPLCECCGSKRRKKKEEVLGAQDVQFGHLCEVKVTLYCGACYAFVDEWVEEQLYPDDTDSTLAGIM